MKFIFTLLFLISSLFATSQVMTSSCTPTLQLIQLYKNDAYKYATLRIVSINSSYKDSIEIPAIYRDSIARVFYAIHNMASSPVKDTIMNLFGYSNFFGNYYEGDSLHYLVAAPSTNSNLQSIYSLSAKSAEMYVSNTVAWASQWAVGNYNNTSEPRINQLVNQYQLSVVTGTGLPNNYYFKVTASSAINPLGLARRFNEILASTTACTPFRFVGDGNGVQLVYQTGGIQITYSNRCGDCPAGCQTGRAWTFLVAGDCSVQYLGATNLGFPLTITPPYFYTCTRGPVLPITFGSFTSYLQSGKPALNWKVLTQVNVKEYIIERSDDGSQFHTVDKVAATTANTAEYSWKDAQVLNGTAWFRIKAVDVDGRVKYSSVAKLSNSRSDGITIYPNPVQNHQFTIQFVTPLSGQLQVRLYDISGKQAWSSTINLTPQTASRTFILPTTLPTGSYSVVIQNETINYKQTLIISNK